MNRLYINKDWSMLKKLIAIKAAGGGAPMVEYTATGNPATFETNVIAPMELLIPFAPVQDLHGYDNPWPAGGSKNMIPDGNDTSNGYIVSSYLKNDGTTARSNDYYVSEYFPVTGGASYTWGQGSGPQSTTLNAPSVCFYDSSKNYISGSGVAMGNTVSHSITAPANASYARSTQISASYNTTLLQFEEGSTATVSKPYSNICPISGWTGANVTRTGKNLANMVYDGYVPSMSTGQLVPYHGTHSQFIEVIPSTTYAYSFGDNHLNVIFEYDGNKNFLKATNVFSVVAGNITTSAQTGYIMLRCDISGPGNDVSNCQLEFGSTATAYEPYAGQQYSIVFPAGAGTVYGGTLTVNKDGSGSLVVDMASVTYNGSESGWSAEGYRFKIAKPSYFAPQESQIGNSKVICNQAFLKYANEYGAEFSITNFSVYANAIDANETLESFKARIGANNLQVVGMLATQIEYDLTPGQVKTLLGVNNVWSDTNGVNTIKYMKKG